MKMNSVNNDDIEFAINNIVNLPSKSEPCIISFLRNRYVNDLHYTWAGSTLLAIRPYGKENKPLDNKIEIIDDNRNNPSIYNVVSKAVFRLKLKSLQKSNQSIVISGESGSGKTYTARLVLKCIAELCRDDNNDVAKILTEAWSIVPLLSAFGNATTLRNDSSSRFGQLFQLRYDDNKLVSVHVKTYLLEKSRVSGPNDSEGNFHIFQQILKNESDEKLLSLGLSKDVNYNILGIKEANTSIAYKSTLDAFDNLKIERKYDIYKVLSIILNLGNVRFGELNGSFAVAVDSLVHIEIVSKLLKVESEDLKKLFTTRLISINLTNNSKRTSVYYTPCLNKSECENRRNCMMRYLYEKLFLWLVRLINKKIDRNPSSSYFLGVLDVYGFETFETNMFEQLCINYANEKLQSYFTSNYFKRNDIDEDEQLDDKNYIEKINDKYSKRLRLFDDQLSLFGILNEVCLIKSVDSDKLLMQRLSEELKIYHDINVFKSNQREFTINHYAGPVKYNIKNMVAKNKDKVPREIIDFLTTKCQFDFLNAIQEDNATSHNMDGQTTLSKFTKSLSQLTKLLDETEVQYIKCVKPNGFNVIGYLDGQFFKNQLLANGIFDIVKLAFQRFSMKLPLIYYGVYFKEIIKLVQEVWKLKIEILISKTNLSYFECCMK